MPLLLGLTVEQFEGITSAISLLGLQQMVERSYFFFQLYILLAGVLFELDFLMQNCLFVTEVAHRVDETLQSEL